MYDRRFASLRGQSRRHLDEYEETEWEDEPDLEAVIGAIPYDELHETRSRLRDPAPFVERSRFF